MQQGSTKEARGRATNSKVIFCFLEGHLLPWPILQRANSSAECNFPSISGPVNIITLLILNFKWSAQVEECPFSSQDSAPNWENRGLTCQELDRQVGNKFVFFYLLKSRWHTTNRNLSKSSPTPFFSPFERTIWHCSEWIREITFACLVLSRPDWSLYKKKSLPLNKVYVKPTWKINSWQLNVFKIMYWFPRASKEYQCVVGPYSTPKLLWKTLLTHSVKLS